jgi:protein-serine/threonine kinase
VKSCRRPFFLTRIRSRRLDDSRFCGNFEQCIADEANSFSYQAAPPQSTIQLRDLSNIERTDLKPYCLLLETRDKRYYLSMKGDEELYGWQDDIYSRSPLSGVSNPTNFVHKVHVGFDPISGLFTVRQSPPLVN